VALDDVDQRRQPLGVWHEPWGCFVDRTERDRSTKLRLQPDIGKQEALM
jgi:hypothetical protein